MWWMQELCTALFVTNSFNIVVSKLLSLPCICVPLLVDNMASVVWVWDMRKMSLVAVLEQTSAVRCFQWDPRRPRLALCTGNTTLYLWSPAGCVSVQVPTEGRPLRVKTQAARIHSCIVVFSDKEEGRSLMSNPNTAASGN